jgi:mannose-1-phosphate guanylyltransferase
MAGGEGKRFWPLSSKENPKQFLSLAGEKSLIRQTVEDTPFNTHRKNIYRYGRDLRGKDVRAYYRASERKLDLGAIWKKYGAMYSIRDYQN